MNIYLSTAYLAPVQYYKKLIAPTNVFIEQHENYIKQTYRNRCNILSANGVMPLSIPVEHQKSAKIQIKDIRITYQNNWQHLHWNAIISAYNSTPFFEYYKDDFRPFYEKKFEFLFDFNEGLRTLICELLDINTNNIQYTNLYETGLQNDFREIIHPKKKTVDTDPEFIANSYYQVFAHKFGFTENLSIIDLLFNMGNESLLVLNK
ncbi:hypothetical protein D0T53_05825 [Dysgonomonas sp. 216]|uniref:WbqC family protein n=1 Tax=Dysgonomonas sp. 216 TaxID=2302934 RepID=UPI0013D7EF04|nr:WbqC family protein [Dysgonomonas sp. 216]NDW18434.1 hypothetical protein [Dysgonomonas sp. 216]